MFQCKEHECKKGNFNVRNSNLSSLQYFPGFFERLKYKLNKYNISFVAKPSIKLKSIVCMKTDPTKPNQLSGVFEIPSIKEDGTVQSYIGMANRKLITRIKEHVADIKYNKKTIDLARLYNKEPLQK